MRLKMLVAACLVAVGLADPGGAEEGPVVLELYTSQGCSSCPPADEMLREMAAREDVIALALHVDYWDYIGWADSFADPRFTERQKSYARVAGARTVFTPQIVIGGQDHVIGARPGEVAELILSHAAEDHGVALQLARSGDTVEVAAEAEGAFARPVVVQLVRYRPQAVVEIGRGENAGHTYTYANIVTDWQVVGAWDGQQPLDLRLPAPGDQPVVVIVQEPGPGPILAAARLR